jgi:hypothetical protein
MKMTAKPKTISIETIDRFMSGPRPLNVMIFQVLQSAHPTKVESAIIWAITRSGAA